MCYGSCCQFFLTIGVVRLIVTKQGELITVDVQLDRDTGDGDDDDDNDDDDKVRFFCFRLFLPTAATILFSSL